VVLHASVGPTLHHGPRLACCGGGSAAPSSSVSALRTNRRNLTSSVLRSKQSPKIYAAASDPSRTPHVAATAGAGATSPTVAASSSATITKGGPIALFIAARESIKGQFSRLEGLWDRFIPMSLLFFLMAFINTIIDSLKDSLVITAVGGGTEVLPYLSVYGVLPSSVLFLVAYSWGTQRFSRERLFNFIICGFLAFYATFAYVYPHHETLHLSAWADSLATWLPSGFSGFVGMARNWLFTLFYCFSELWGDIALSLLFWGLANETTSIEDAPLLYPLFGIGANVAQTLAGRALRVFSDASDIHMSYTHQLQGTISLCVCLGLVVLGLHAFISRTFPVNPKGSTIAKINKEKAVQVAKDAANAKAAAAAAAVSAVVIEGETSEERLQRMKVDLEATVRGLNYCDVEEHAHSTTTSSSTSSSTTSATATGISSPTSSFPPPHAPAIKKSMGMKEAFMFLRKSPQIRCLAMMAIAQGITTRLLEVSWKHYLHKLHTTPAAYAAFLGDTAMWTGIVTGSLMFTSPMLFDRIGWKGVASTTPNFMFWGGIPFFIGCIAYNLMADKTLAIGAMTLQALVITGAILQVLSKGAKFSLFKPAEEMVYIGLDDESRSKGKAAIDVVGAQSGKSVVSVMQQALLILTGGTVGGILPMLAVFYAIMLHRWIGAVEDLAEHHDPAHVHRQSIMGSVDEEIDDLDVSGGRSSSSNGSGESASSNYDVPSPAAA
jgi:AAA family ATP:ADP antiporter